MVEDDVEEDEEGELAVAELHKAVSSLAAVAALVSQKGPLSDRGSHCTRTWPCGSRLSTLPGQ